MRSYSFNVVDDMDGVGSGMGPLADSETPNSSHPHSIGSDGRLFSVTSLISQAERVITVHQRLKNTMTCIVIYVVLMMLNVFVMSWEMAGRSDNTTHTTNAPVQQCGWADGDLIIHKLYAFTFLPFLCFCLALSSGYNPVIIILECLINLFIISEVTIGIYGLGREYFKSWMNVVDFFLAIGCVVFFIFLMITQTQEEADYMSEVDAVLLAFRFLFQVIRLSVLIYRSRKVALMQAQEEVDFNSVSLEACIDEEASSRRSQRTFSEDVGLDHFPHTPGLHIESLNGSYTNGTPSSSNPTTAAVTTTSLHLKPSIYLELQNARAFAAGGEIPSTSDSNSTKSLHSHSNSAVTGFGLTSLPLPSPSPQLNQHGGAVNVPMITPPRSPDLILESDHSAQSSASSRSSAASSASSSFNGRGPIHPRLANDSDELEEDEIDFAQHQQQYHASQARRSPEEALHAAIMQEADDHTDSLGLV